MKIMLVKMRQMQKISREDLATREEPSETTRQAPRWTKRQRIVLAYLNGALGDASRNKKSRIRYAQKYPKWLELLQQLLAELGSASWIYKEGKDRQVYVLETCCSYLDFDCNEDDLELREEKIAYIRGFFDAEGGVPHSENAKFYIQLVQKDRPKIEMLSRMLTSLDISTGAIHNPSVRVDPEYWRVFISTRSHRAFAQIIGSWHPVKGLILQSRMKI
jgi:intein/homing endonuclease